MTATAFAPRRGGFVSFRLAARLARREILRRPGRTALVALLVAMPVAGMIVADVMVRTEHGTPLQHWEAQYGQADAVASGAARPVLPPHRSIVWQDRFDTRVLRTVDHHRSMVGLSRPALADPLTRGIYQLTSGRAPTEANEVFLTRRAAHELGVGVGDTLDLERPARRSFLVTAVGESAQVWGTTAMVLPPAAPYPWKAPVNVPNPGRLIEFTERPSASQLRQLAADRATDAVQISPAVLAPPYDPYGGDDSNKKVAWSWVIGAVVLTVVGIVIASAFAIGARRQLVTLGQLSGNGAGPAVLRRVLFLQGTLTGIIGTIAGAALAAIALASLAPHADRVFGHDVHPYTTRPTDLVPICLLGVVTATVAALVPARTASRIPVLAALAGRRPLARVPRWLPLTGAFVATAGLALLGLAVLGARGGDSPNVWALTAIVGGIAVLLGGCAIAPFYVSVLEPAATRARGAWRVATRSLARQRTRTSAVVSAIAATTALTIAGSALFLSAHAHDTRSQYQLPANAVVLAGTGTAGGPRAPSPGLATDVERALPRSHAYQLSRPRGQNLSWYAGGLRLEHPTTEASLPLAGGFEIATTGKSGLDGIGIADDALLDAYGLTDADREELTQHGALVLAGVRGRLTLTAVAHGRGAPPARRIEAAVVDGGRYRIASLPSVLLSEEKAAELGVTIAPSWLLLRTPKALTSDQRNLIADLATDANDARGPDARVYDSYNFFYPPTGLDPMLLQGLLVAVALALTLFVVAVNLALSASETRDERDVLTVVGAAPRALSRANGYKAAMLTAMGATLAIPLGLLPVAVFYAASSDDVRLVLPYAVMALLVVVVPVAAGLITSLGSALALRVRPVRISTMAYD